MLHVKIPLRDEEDDGWMLKVEEEYLLNYVINLSDVVSTFIDEIFDIMETHETVQTMLLDLIHQISFYL